MTDISVPSNDRPNNKKISVAVWFSTLNVKSSTLHIIFSYLIHKFNYVYSLVSDYTRFIIMFKLTSFCAAAKQMVFCILILYKFKNMFLL